MRPSYTCVECDHAWQWVRDGRDLRYCARHQAERAAHRERAFRAGVIAHPVARDRAEIRRAFLEARAEREEAELNDLVRQVDDDRVVF